MILTDANLIVNMLKEAGWVLDNNYRIESTSDVVFELSRPVGEGINVVSRYDSNISYKRTEFKDKITLVSDPFYFIDFQKELLLLMAPQKPSGFLDNKKMLSKIKKDGWRLNFSIKNNIFHTHYYNKKITIDDMEYKISIQVMFSNGVANIVKCMSYKNEESTVIGNIDGITDEKIFLAFIKTEVEDVRFMIEILKQI